MWQADPYVPTPSRFFKIPYPPVPRILFFHLRRVDPYVPIPPCFFKISCPLVPHVFLVATDLPQCTNEIFKKCDGIGTLGQPAAGEKKYGVQGDETIKKRDGIGKKG